MMLIGIDSYTFMTKHTYMIIFKKLYLYILYIKVKVLEVSA